MNNASPIAEDSRRLFACKIDTRPTYAYCASPMTLLANEVALNERCANVPCLFITLGDNAESINSWMSFMVIRASRRHPTLLDSQTES